MAEAPRPSRDLNVIQEAVRSELAAIMARAGGSGEMMPVGQCREELLSLRSEFSSQIEGMRSENREEFQSINRTLDGIGKTLATQNTEAVLLKQQVASESSLIKQRLDMQADADKRVAAALASTKGRGDPTPLMGRTVLAPPAPPMQVNPVTNPPAASDPDTRPLIPTAIVNSIVLAVAAGIGGTVWHFTEHWLFPDKHEAKTEQAATLPPAAK